MLRNRFVVLSHHKHVYKPFDFVTCSIPANTGDTTTKRCLAPIFHKIISLYLAIRYAC